MKTIIVKDEDIPVAFLPVPKCHNRTCNKPARLLEHNGYYRWNCCGYSWVVEYSAMDLANTLTERNSKND